MQKCGASIRWAVVANSPRPLARRSWRAFSTAVTRSWSDSLSHAAPESDFTAPSTFLRSTPHASFLRSTPHASFWSGFTFASPDSHSSASRISFATPESDFCGERVGQEVEEKMEEVSNEEERHHASFITFATPESDFCGAFAAPRKEQHLREDFINHAVSNERARSTMAYSLSFATAESDFQSQSLQALLDDRMKRQLEHVERHHGADTTPARSVLHGDSTVELDDVLEEVRIASEYPRDVIVLPRTFAEAVSPDEHRAVVVTEPVHPHRIVAVNAAWEGLCGYTASYSEGKTLSILQGKETDMDAINSALARLHTGEETATVLTNYRGSTGETFRNDLRMGPLKDADDNVTHFVGILREISVEASTSSSYSTPIDPEKRIKL